MGYLGKIKARRLKYMATPVAETNIVQIHHFDPNGIKVEVTFEDEAIPVAGRCLLY